MASPTSSAKLDLRTICDVLGGIEHKWFKIGIQLGIPHEKLQQFKKEDDPLSAVIDYWLRGNVPEKESLISWKFIAKALRSKYVGEPGLAEEISKGFCQLESTCEDRKDYAKVISDTVPINTMIEDKLQHKENKDTGGDSLPDAASPEASQSCKKKTSLQESKSPLEDRDTQPQEKKLDPKVRMDLDFILKRNLQEIIVKFASYVDCLRMAIKDKGVSTEDLRSYLLSLPMFTKNELGSKFPPHLENLGLLSDKKTELKNCETVTEIFDYLKTECTSFLNYEIFQHILEHYGISDNQEKLKYPKHLRAYAEKHKISEFSKINPLSRSKSGCTELIVKYDIETTCSLAKVIDLKFFIAQAMDLSPSALHIVDIEDGCVIVVFLIPASVASDPLKRFSFVMRRQIPTHPILWMKCDGYLETAKTMQPTWATEAKKPRGIAVSQRAKLDLRTICDVLGGIENKWFKIGVQLGIPLDMLQQFKKEDDPLSAVIDYWLRGNVPEEESPISWESIAKALRSKHVGEPGLAEEVSKDFCQQEAISEDGKVDCAKVIPDTVPINTTTERHKENKDTGGDPLPEAALPEASQSHENKTSLQEKLDPKVITDLEFILKRNLKKIIATFASYVDCLCMAIKEKNVSTEDLRSYLLSLPMFIKNNDNEQLPFIHDDFILDELKLLSDKKTELKKCLTVTDIFDFLKTECTSFLNHDIFEYIRKHYDISDDKEELKYPEHLRAYVEKHKISEFAKINLLPRSKSGCTELTVKLDIKTTCSLAKIHDLKYFIAEIMELNPSVLEIVDIEDGCVIVTFMIPTLVADVILKEYSIGIEYPIGNKLIADLQEGPHAESVIWIKCAGRMITKKIIKQNWATEARKPRGIAINQTGELIVAECGVHCVTVLSASGEKLRSFGTRGSGEGQFEYPYGVAVDSEDNILVADCGNHRIQKFTAEGKFLAAVGSQDSGPLQFDLPSAITVSASNGRVYVVNGNETITILNSDLSHYRTFGHEDLKKADQIASDSKGNIYVAGSTRLVTDSIGFVTVFSDEGNHLRNLKGSLYSSTVAITPNDRVVVSHEKNIGHYILSILSSDDQLLQDFTVPRNLLEDSQYHQFPHYEETEFSGLTVDQAHNIYMCDYLNNRISCYSLTPCIVIKPITNT